MQYDLLHIQGKPYVLVPLHDYRHMAEGDSGSALPDDVLDQISTRAEHPVKIIRKFRKMTQHDLAEKSGISRPYLTEIETGKKDGSIRAIRALAEALDVRLADVA